MVTEELPEELGDDEPRRVHPLTILIWFLKKAPQNVVGLPAIIGFTSGRGFGWILLAAGVVGALSLVWTWVNWRRFTYAVTPHELVIERGILSRTRRSIPLERIQDVGIEQGPLSRIFGLAEVRVETGGGEKDEAVLDSVSLSEAARLRGALRGAPVRRATVGLDDNGDVLPEEDALSEVFAMSPQRVLLLGLFSFSLVWIAALAGAIQFIGDAMGFGWDEATDLWRTARGEVGNRLNYSTGFGLFGVVVLLGVITGIGRTVLRDWNFTLRAGIGRFRRTRGLLTRSEVVVAMRRIQLALVQRGPLRGALGWNTLSFQTLGGSNDPSGRQVMAPLARDHEVAAIIDRAGLPPFERLPLRRVAPGHVVRAALTAMPVPVAVVAGALLLTPLAWLGLAVAVPMVAIALLQRSFHRYAVRESSLQVMRGVLLQNDWIVPVENIQVVTLSETLLQRLLGLVTVRVDTAGAGVGATPAVVDLVAEDARALARDLAGRIT
ncbi:PH domain-containing protein [Sphingomonas suaedae]|uniref:PH domain-containing protein n=1 Tax=Sphingomonas suaedae TaxID=2599297 RepID=A0A518RB45_9SPHN|nr:PH domain-containing protein [Sphingomonas suaedae]QDX24676.1 PH domain-containing protein [Sphingomonas suaedae]